MVSASCIISNFLWNLVPREASMRVSLLPRYSFSQNCIRRCVNAQQHPMRWFDILPKCVILLAKVWIFWIQAHDKTLPELIVLTKSTKHRHVPVSVLYIDFLASSSQLRRRRDNTWMYMVCSIWHKREINIHYLSPAFHSPSGVAAARKTFYHPCLLNASHQK